MKSSESKSYVISSVEVTGFRRGSIIVEYRIVVRSTEGAYVTKEMEVRKNTLLLLLFILFAKLQATDRYHFN